EMVHVAIPRAPIDNFAGICPFRGDCLERMASGPTLEKRWGRTGSELNELLDQATEVESLYRGTVLASFTLTLGSTQIVLGGGVFKIQGLIERVRDRVHNYLNGYVHGLENRKNLDKFVVPPGLGDRSGITGALALAMSAEVPHSN
ncbi:MAG: ROK family protein, partial [Acidobacteria bacterium]|nr:ROK family protein [Acidobacteriota bacterium]